MNFHLLSQVVNELSTVFPDARVERVFDGADGNLYFILRLNRKNYILLLSHDRAMPRMHLITAKPKASDSSSGFLQYLKSRLTGAKITGVSLLNRDRVAELRFVKSDTEYRLIFELMASSTNLLLTDSTYKILSASRLVPITDTIKRPMLPGLTYIPPEKKLQHSAHAALPPSDGNRDEFRPEPDAECPANRGAEIFYEQLVARKRREALRAGLLSLVRKNLSRATRRISALLGDMDSAKKADTYRQAGELILANQAGMERGLESVVLTGYDGGRITVELDPKLSLSRNAEMYFKKYKKAKAGIGIITERLRQSQEEESYLKSSLSDIGQAKNGDALDCIRVGLVERGYLKQIEQRRTDKKSGPNSPVFRKFFHKGWEILVGKSAASNDYITMKLARPDDLWLHADGLPGSHVLVRNPRGEDVPTDVVKKAASLAAYYSRGKAAGKVSVTYTLAKFVKKPKGAKPGAVTLSVRKTVMAAPEGV